MGVSINCILIYNTSPMEILEELKVSLDEEKEVDTCYLPRRGEILISPW